MINNIFTIFTNKCLINITIFDCELILMIISCLNSADVAGHVTTVTVVTSIDTVAALEKAAGDVAPHVQDEGQECWDQDKAVEKSKGNHNKNHLEKYHKSFRWSIEHPYDSHNGRNSTLYHRF